MNDGEVNVGKRGETHRIVIKSGLVGFFGVSRKSMIELNCVVFCR